MAQTTFRSSTGTGTRQRHNIRVLYEQYKDGQQSGDKSQMKPLCDYLRAWTGIQKLDPENSNSFFMIAGYHGAPFRGAGWGNPEWWGGYCNHGNVLFPTWHRAYLWRLENALRSIKDCGDVALAYWDETEAYASNQSVPEIFLLKNYTDEDGQSIRNPLYSYTFQRTVWDDASLTDPNSNNPANYTKHGGYETQRYPRSGLMSEDDEAQILKYNANISDAEAAEALKANVTYWLDPHVAVDPKSKDKNTIGIRRKWKECLEAPNYTVFSNTTSAQHYNEITFDNAASGKFIIVDGKVVAAKGIVPVESPHNDMHLSVGGFHIGAGDSDFPSTTGNPYDQANGDMGENETAAFDPIFFHHHCFVDKVFWDWQQLHEKDGATDMLTIIDGYPGTNSVDAQGPTPGVAGGTWLTLDSPLDPFKKKDDPQGPAMTSRDVVNIERDLHYTYVPVHTGFAVPHATPLSVASHHAKITGINRGSIPGSFVLATYKTTNGKKELLGYESILSRWHTSGCSNCQTHLNVKTFIPLHNISDHDKIEAVILQRGFDKDGKFTGSQAVPLAAPKVIPTAPQSTT